MYKYVYIYICINISIYIYIHIFVYTYIYTVYNLPHNLPGYIHPFSSKYVYLNSLAAWSLSDKQPGDPYIWHHGYLNLENYDVAGFKFALRLRQKCLKHCGYVAFDDVTLQCEAEEKTQVPLEKCERRTTPLPGCGINVLQPVHKGRRVTAFSVLLA